MEIKKNDELLRKIGYTLLQLRTKAGLKQEQVAREIGIKQETLSKYENGGTDFTISIIAVFSEYYKVDINEIINISRHTQGLDSNNETDLNEGYRLYIEQLKNENTFLKDQLKAGR